MEKFTKRENLFLVVTIFLGILSLFFLFNYSYLAFPEIKIDRLISREEAQNKAIEFLMTQNVDVGQYKKVTVFNSNDYLKEYLEKKLGTKKAGELMNKRFSPWSFNNRFFRPSEQEEFYVSYDNEGKFSSFYKEIAEDKAGDRLDEGAAQKIAENFIINNTDFSLDKLKLIEKDFTERKNRKDHYFTWENPELKINEATYRVEVVVAGSEIVKFSQYLKIPEEWTRAELTKLTYNNTAQTVAEVFYFLLLLIPLFVILFKKFRAKQLNYRLGIKIGIIVSVVSLLSFVNSLPLSLYYYNTLESWSNFWANSIFGGVFGSLLSGLNIFLIIISAEAIYRQIFPEAISLDYFFKRSFFKNKVIFKSIFFGFFGGIIVLVYQVLYYMLGRKINFWVPAEINYGNIFSTYLPWTYALFIGLVPVITEEIVFRLFGISFFKKIFKRSWLAIILTSLIWAFLHSNYPQQPFYARGVELTLVGLFLGWLYLRFGILTSITAHFTINATLSTQFLFKYENLYVRLSSALVFLLPLIVCLAIFLFFLRQKGFSDTKKMENIATVPMVKKEKLKPSTTKKINIFNCKTLSTRNKLILIFLTVAGGISLLVFTKFIRIDYFKFKEPNLALNRYQISELADFYLKNKSIEPSDYYKVITAEEYFSDDEAVDYIIEKGSVKDLEEIYNKEIPAMVWRVRYFKPEEKESYFLNFFPDGRIYSYSHIIPENAVGNALTEEDAKVIAEKYLSEEKGWKLNNYSLVDKTQFKQDNRIDYSFIFEDNYKRIDQATLRADVEVQGSKINGFSQYIKIPDDWFREKNKETLKDFIIEAFLFIIFLGIFILGFVTLLIFYRKKLLRFKESFRVIVFFVAPFSLLSFINELPTFYSSYFTTEPFLLFYFEKIILFLLGLVFIILVGTLILSFFLAFWRESFNSAIFPEQSVQRKKILWQSIFIGYGLTLFLEGFFNLIDYITFPSFLKLGWIKFLVGLPTLPNGINTFLPFLSIFDSIFGFFLGFTILSIFLLLLYRYLKKWWIVFIVLLIIIIPAIFLEKNLTNIIPETVMFISVLAVFSVLYLIFFRNNILSLFLTLFAEEILTVAPSFWNSNILFQINSILIYSYLLLPIILIYFLTIKKKNFKEESFA